MVTPTSTSSTASFACTQTSPTEHMARRVAGLRRGAERRLDRPVENLDHVEDGDLVGRALEGETPVDAAVRLQDAGPPQSGKELLEKLSRDTPSLSQNDQRHGTVRRPARKFHERAHRVFALRRDVHPFASPKPE